MRTGTWTFNITLNGKTDADSTFINMPDVSTFLFNSHKHITSTDISGMSFVNLRVNKQSVAGYIGSTLTLKYSPIFSTNVSDYVNIGMVPVSVNIDNENTFLESGWIEIDPNVFGNESDDIFITVIGNGGNNIISPNFGHISVSFK